MNAKERIELERSGFERGVKHSGAIVRDFLDRCRQERSQEYRVTDQALALSARFKAIRDLLNQEAADERE